VQNQYFLQNRAQQAIRLFGIQRAASCVAVAPGGEHFEAVWNVRL